MPMHEFLTALRDLLGTEHVITDPVNLAPYRHDWLPGDYPLPDVVVRPTDPAHLPAIVRLAQAAGLPVVARGAGTGLAGGARPIYGGVVIDLSRLCTIEQIDIPNRQVLAHVGVITYALSAAVAGQGWFYAPDPASWQMCTIGGNIANNSGGPRCLKYGVTTNHVLALEVTLADGRQGWIGDGTETFTWHGYDLIGLLVGSEGTLAVIGRAWLRLTRKPEANRVALALFPDVVSACAAVSAILAAGYVPTALEVMDATTMLAVNRAQQADLPAEAGAALIIEIDGVTEGLDETMAEIEVMCRRYGAFQIRTAVTIAEQERLWAARRSAFASFHTLAPSFYLVDTVVPRTRLPAMMAHTQRLSTQYGLPIANVFHAGDGNLHPLVLYDPSDPVQVAKAHAITADVLALSIAEGGAVSGEHGIGVEKRDFLARLYRQADLAVHATVYAVFNSEHRLNPGKVFPVGLDPLALAAERTAGLVTPQSLAREHLPAALAEVVGAAYVLTGTDTTAYAVQGRLPALVVLPATTTELAGVMSLCYQAGVHVVPWGGGTQQAIGQLATDPDVVVVTRRLQRVVAYEPDDLTIRVEAGMTLAELKRILAAHRQQFPLEIADEAQATLGGLLATDTNGSRRSGYGTLRDLVLGLTVVQVDGTVVQLGGQVVKNVSGYDVVKLFIGSHGTLGIISEVSLRTFPCPPATVSIVTGFADHNTAVRFLNELTTTQLQPVSAVYLDSRLLRTLRIQGEAGIALRFEGHPAACRRQLDEMVSIAYAVDAHTILIERGTEQARIWNLCTHGTALPQRSDTWPIQLAVKPTEFWVALQALTQTVADYGAELTVSGQPYHGLITGEITGKVTAVAAILTALLKRWPHVRIPAGVLPDACAPQRWGYAADPLIPELTARLKQAFDPLNRLNRRWWPYSCEPVIGNSASVSSVTEHLIENHMIDGKAG